MPLFQPILAVYILLQAIIYCLLNSGKHSKNSFPESKLELGDLIGRVSWSISIDFRKPLRQNFLFDFLQAADEIIIDSILDKSEIGSNITDLLDVIPTIATNVISNRFCREYGVQCNGQVWLNNQGQEQRNWPRFGVLTSVALSYDEKLFGEIWNGLITKCSGITFNTLRHNA